MNNFAKLPIYNDNDKVISYLGDFNIEIPYSSMESILYELKEIH